VKFDVFQSNTQARVFDERQDVVLAANLPVNVTAPGIYNQVADLTPGSIPAGTVVRSHFIHTDKVGTKAPYVTFNGTVTVDQDILGLSVLGPSLSAGDGPLGAPGTLYPTGQNERKLELRADGSEDLVEWVDARTVRFHLETAAHADQIRIITEGVTPANPAIDIEKYVLVIPQASPGDVCDTLGKPKKLTFRYTGDGNDATSHSQDAGKVVVTGDPNDTTPVFIKVTNKSNPTDASAKVWFSGTVALDGSFLVDATAAGDTRLGSNSWAYIYDATGTTLLQTVQFHTSCSQPINLGDQYGSLKLVGFVGEGGGSATLPDPPAGPGDDADTPTGPSAVVGDTVRWTYIVTNPGDVPLSDVMVTDDNGTPGDPGDDFSPDPVQDGAFNVGDANGDGLLDPGEEWRYVAEAPAAFGQYANLGTVVGTPVPPGPPVTDDDPAHYVGDFAPGDVCDTLGKPKKLTFRYTGDGNDATSHDQDAGKVVVTGDPNDATPVFIKVTNKSNPADASAKVWFSGTVALDGSFVVDATAAGANRLETNTWAYIYDATGTTLLQTVQFHTSCSQPINLGDQYGSLKLLGFVGEGGGSAGIT
jgi:hypothetical protein